MSNTDSKREIGTQLPLFEFEQENLDKIRQHQPIGVGGDNQFSKFIVYVDESGDHSLQSIDPQYPIFVLAFCVFHKRHYSEVIVPALEKFKFNHFGHDQIVLHENEIRRRTGQFNIFRSSSHQQTFMDQLTEIIEFSNFVLISATVDKRPIAKSNPGDNAYHIALALCMEKLHAFLCEKHQHEKKTHIVVERRGSREDDELELEFRRVCDGNNSLGINLPFEILFAHKQVMSSGLQLADLVARPIGLKTLRPAQDNRAFESLRQKFYCEGGRNAVGDGYENVGMMIYPTPKSEKPQ
ncbi:DUF3800 domain-containing protein [Lacimicrobium alkaliphilum]|uniref:3-deoxy-D-manno-octulosonic acid transferase n=1 Tax=Lacimicrobium alkaliphilum TaxID=1526571 RepID=A0ABQ1R8N3_9ALTE|nr:DUF3800 domain-containing protein [Lacimicrobium alkaliphilum]GGD59667.1 3-deoxy-D-manno-octulosonic acid transferase [Lacimicrobium alkaliphilum]